MRKVSEPTPSSYAAEPRAPRSTSVVEMRASTARPGKSYHHGDLRQALLDATLALIEEHGPEGFTLRAAARKAGVTASATYHHFKDKEDLVTGVAEQGFELLRRQLLIAAQKPAPNDRERSRTVGVAYVVFATQHPTRFRVMVGHGLLARNSSANAAVGALHTYRFVRSVLLAGLNEHAAHEASEAQVLGWWSVVHGLAFLAIDGHLGKSTKDARRAEEVVRGVLDALDPHLNEPATTWRRQLG